MYANYNPFDHSGEIYGSNTLHRETGYYISRLEKYNSALKYFDKGIKETPDDQRTLTGRAIAKTKIGKYEEALEDINHALSLEPDDLNLLAKKARDTYLCCEFEQGLVQNTQLLSKRDVFRMGKMDCTIAIENCVDEKAGRPLRDHYRIIRKLAWKKNLEAQKPFEPAHQGKSSNAKKELPSRLKHLLAKEHGIIAPRKRQKSLKSTGIKDALYTESKHSHKIPPVAHHFPFKPLQNYTSNLEDFMAEKYLDGLYIDKRMIKNVKSDPRICCPNQKSTKKLYQIAHDCYQTVYRQQEVLRTRRPFYSIRYQEAKISGKLKERIEQDLELQRQNIKREADNILRKLMSALDNHNHAELLALTEKLKTYCDSKPKKILPDKECYLDAIYDSVCKSFYHMYRVNTQKSLYEQNKTIYATLGVPLSRQPSLDSISGQLNNIFRDFKQEIHVFEKRLEVAVTSEEICWCYHELARFNLEQKRFNVSLVYSKKCIKEAELIKNYRWVLNSYMLVCKADILQHNKLDAKQDLLQALKAAELLKDAEKVKYLNQCIEVVRVIEFDDVLGAQEIENRQNNILTMITDTNLKSEAAFLFKQMSTLPANRRMTVVPGVQVHSTPASGGDKCRKMSITPQKLASPSLSQLKKTLAQSNANSLMDLVS